MTMNYRCYNVTEPLTHCWTVPTRVDGCLAPPRVGQELRLIVPPDSSTDVEEYQRSGLCTPSTTKENPKYILGPRVDTVCGTGGTGPKSQKLGTTRGIFCPVRRREVVDSFATTTNVLRNQIRIVESPK